MLHQTEYKLPLCITFGSPLLGDTTFQQVVSCNLTWNSCYLHVVQKGDCVPRLLPTTGQSSYKPFGTFLLCSESGYACFQAPESIAELLKYESPRVFAGNLASQTFDYRNAVERSEKLLLHRNVSSFLGNEAFFTIKAESYKVGIAAQVIAAGFWQRQQQNEAIHAHVENIAKHERNVIKRQREVFDPTKELKEMKVCLGSLEWYMDICRANGHGPGYYDSFKNAQERRDNGVDKYKTYLTEYWKQVVEDAEEKPQEVGAPLRKRWLFAGTNYRRIVEPLDIAEYYRRGRKDYLTRRRSNHYKLLEKWLKDYQDSERAGKTKETKDGRSVVTVTEDSCFWAHVEEAIRSCRLLDRASSEQEKLTKFEEYVMDLIGEKKVSSDIFLEKSNYMQWWKEYQDKVAHQSPLMDYMKAGRYKGYGKGSQFNSNGSPADTSPGPTTSGDPHR
ncbi:hypothetical protein BT93_E1607 [Corymbia citriodora subsp. variegata]|nr:hypothetical protein BT93_E1607 [Corymbia citriodora subsp. variegata]